MRIFVILLCFTMLSGCGVYLLIPFAITLLLSWLNSAVEMKK